MTKGSKESFEQGRGLWKLAGFRSMISVHSIYGISGGIAQSDCGPNFYIVRAHVLVNRLIAVRCNSYILQQ